MLNKKDNFVFETIGDTHQRLNNTVVIFDNTFCLVNNMGLKNSKGDVILMSELSDPNTRVDPKSISVRLLTPQKKQHWVDLLDPKLNYINYQLGFVNITEDYCEFISQSVGRSQRQGLYESNTSRTTIGMVEQFANFSYLSLGYLQRMTECFLLKRYPTLKEACARLGKQGCVSVALSRNFAVGNLHPRTKKLHTIYYSKEPQVVVGYISKDSFEPEFTEEFFYLEKYFDKEVSK